MVDGMGFSGMGNLYVQAVPPPDLNKNTEWFMYPGVWTTYILILFFSWLIVLSVFGCSPGMAWTIVNLCHFVCLIFGGKCCCHCFGNHSMWSPINFSIGKRAHHLLKIKAYITR